MAELTKEAHAGDGDEHDEKGHGHGLAHVASVKVLLSTWGALTFFTVLTVLAAKIDFSSASLSLIVALVIATMKASLVCLFFMHLRYDKPIHAVIFLSSLLFLMLFAGLTLMDTGQYQTDIIWNQNAMPTP